MRSFLSTCKSYLLFTDKNFLTTRFKNRTYETRTITDHTSEKGLLNNTITANSIHEPRPIGYHSQWRSANTKKFSYSVAAIFLEKLRDASIPIIIRKVNAVQEMISPRIDLSMMLEEKILPFSTNLMSVSIFHVEVPQEACDSILLFRSFVKRPTAGVTRWWVGRDNAALAEPTSSHANCLKTRRLPSRWVHLGMMAGHHFPRKKPSSKS